MQNIMNEEAVLASVRPKWCFQILSGAKSVEIRKTRPKLKTPFKVYLYCTLPSKRYQTRSGGIVVNTDELFRLPDGSLKHDWSGALMAYPHCTWSENNFLNGKVVGEAVCDRITEFQVYENGSIQYWMFADLEKSCLSYLEVMAYIGAGKKGFAWHLNNPVLYGMPRPIWMMHRPCWNSLSCDSCGMFNTHPAPGFCGCSALQIKRPPQSWCYVGDGFGEVLT